jgi:hypothetical protein
MNRVVESYSNEPPLSDVANFFAASAAQIRIKAHMGFETGCEEGRNLRVLCAFVILQGPHGLSLTNTLRT